MTGVVAQTPEFKRWFGDSAVVDAAGKPLVVYHGTAIPKTEFRRDGGASGVGAYFTESYAVAQDYAEMDASVDGDDPLVIQAYLAIQNPVIFTDGEQSQAITPAQRDAWEAAGHDGVKTLYPDGVEWVAFDTGQIQIIAGELRHRR